MFFDNSGFGFGINQAQEFFIMQSAENANKIINFMSTYAVYNRGASEEDLIKIALNECNLDYTDFTDVDWNNILEKAQYYAFHTRIII